MKIKKLEIKTGQMRQDSLPDVDLDFESGKRDEVKRYLEEKYGSDRVCSVGAYGRFKIRSGLKDISRVMGIDFMTTNQITKYFSDRDETNFDTIISRAIERPEFKSFMQRNPDIINTLELMLSSVKNMSIHASAVLILPDNYKGEKNLKIYDWIPVKKISGQLVSEWEGKYVDIKGILKNDILGLNQLDKFFDIRKLIQEQEGEWIELGNIPLDDKDVYRYFSNGWNEDVFQFNSGGLKAFSKKVKPDNIEDLIAMNALFRPGPMASKSHDKFAKIKHGELEPLYDHPIEELVTKETFGLYVYQEQIMKAVNVIGGLSLIQSDEVRTTMKKFDKVKLATYEKMFIKGAIKNGLEKELAKTIWDKLYSFSSYGFNKSHSTAYSIMSYRSQWFKVNYPLQFYTIALQKAKEEDIPKILNEIESAGLEIKIIAADVNNSSKGFVCDIKTNEIFCSISKVKGLAFASVTSLLHSREQVGSFKSLKHFMASVEKRKVNKAKVVALILAGAFDKIENIKKPKKRKDLLLKFCEKFSTPLDYEKYNNLPRTDFYFTKKQKELTGIGDINYEKLIRKKIGDLGEYVNPIDFYQDEYNKFSKKTFIICGEIEESIARPYKAKKGEWCRLLIKNNNEQLEGVIWDDFYKLHKEKFVVGNVIAIRVSIRFDDYKQKNSFYSMNESEIWELI